jgi:predicted phosphatase
MDKKQIDPTPENFASYEEAAEFWDTHDTTDYLDEFTTVDVSTALHARHFEVEIAEDVIELLQTKASQQGVPIGYLASDLLRRQLQVAA